MLCQGCGKPLQWHMFMGVFCRIFFFFSAGCSSEESQGKDRVVQPCRAAKTGIGRDAEQQDLTRHLVVMG